MQIIGLGTLVTMPLVGNLSDKYGRKALLAVPMGLTIIPLGMYIYVCIIYLLLSCPPNPIKRLGFVLLAETQSQR
jgi:MFS family permease